MVNAIPHQLFKRETQFVQCPALKAGDAAPPQLTVAFIPDPPVAGQTSAFTISGTLSRPVADGDLTGVGFYDPATKSIIGEIVSAPASPTTPFSQELSVPAPAALPAEYLILVMVANPKTEDIIGCAGAMVGGTAKVAAFNYDSVLASYNGLHHLDVVYLEYNQQFLKYHGRQEAINEIDE
ncbi:7737_t:CDS:2 [Entrophospora sp. SA101]|nr:7737_t:CDS:2 [Entrophospora sp. SA101]